MSEQLLEGFPTHLDPLRFLSGHRARTVLTEVDGRRGALCTIDLAVPDPAAALDQPGCGMTVWSTIFWDVRAFGALVAELRNVGPRPLTIRVAWECGESDGTRYANASTITLAPNEESEVVTPIRALRRSTGEAALGGMRGQPTHDDPTDRVYPERVERVRFMLEDPRDGDAFFVPRLTARGTPATEPPIEEPANLLPLIDMFGQSTFGESPNRVASMEELRAAWDAEDTAMADAPDPVPVGRFGGNARAHDTHEATGRFRAERRDGRWMLVDPDGLPFFSLGACCVGRGDLTPIEQRDGWFADPPWDDPEFTDLVTTLGSKTLRGTFAGQRPQSFSFHAANVRRRFGREHEASASRQLIGKRLRHWGYNTIAGFSTFIDPQTAERPCPYTVMANTERGPVIAGTEGFWRAFPDVFDPQCRAALRTSLEAQADRLRSPWCLGVFIDNEQDFGYDDGVPFLVPGIIASPADQPAKRAWLTWLEQKYASIEALNAAWTTRHADWDALRGSKACDLTHATVVADVLAFEDVVLETYFAMCHEELRRVDPDVLYLGTRFSGRAAARVVRAEARYADVLTYNLYHQSMSHLRLPADVDRPIVIGECHFGSVGDNHFHPGLVPRPDAQAVAISYRRFLDEAAAHPQVVGLHWFCWSDQPTTGRVFDGENFGCGLIDVTDQPKPHLTAVTQDFMRRLYGGGSD